MKWKILALMILAAPAAGQSWLTKPKAAPECGTQMRESVEVVPADRIALTTFSDVDFTPDRPPLFVPTRVTPFVGLYLIRDRERNWGRQVNQNFVALDDHVRRGAAYARKLERRVAELEDAVRHLQDAVQALEEWALGTARATLRRRARARER